MSKPVSITGSELNSTTRKNWVKDSGSWERTDPDYIEKSDTYLERKKREIDEAEEHARKIRESKTSDPKIIQHGTRILFGFNGEAPELPDGWTLERRQDAAALAVSPSGEKHLLALNPPRLIPPAKSSPPGQQWWDFEKAILI